MEPAVYVPIITLVVLGGVVFIVRAIRKPKEKDKEQIDEFLNSVEKLASDLIINTLDTIEEMKDDGTILNLDTFVSESLDLIHVNLYDAIYRIAEDEKNTNSISKIAFRCLINKGLLDQFITKIINSSNAKEKLGEIWDEKFEDRLSEAEKADENVKGKFDNEEEYYENEEFDKEDLEPAKSPEEAIEDLPEDIKEKEKEKIANLNPQKDTDEEEEFDEESMDIVENEEELDYFFDSKGRKRNKATGRYMK